MPTLSGLPWISLFLSCLDHLSISNWSSFSADAMA